MPLAVAVEVEMAGGVATRGGVQGVLLCWPLPSGGGRC